ncbi:hypothetical protein BACPU_11670 [Bacillus pumilus]|nr:hypothetical protein BACPU_11670 [Bacillus pumilus]
MQIFYYDENYVYLYEDEISEYDEMPKNATDVRPQEGLYLHKFDPRKKAWYESASKEYIESLQPDPVRPDDVTMLKKQVALLTLQVSQMQRGGAS